MKEVAYNQVTHCVLMVRPFHFGWNEQTAADNVFQHKLTSLSQGDIEKQALQEFDQMVTKLRANGVRIVVIEGREFRGTPDAVFPNNWVSFHADGRVAIFPMYSQNRRLERRMEIFRTLADQERFDLSSVADFTSFEGEEKFLEGTGSMVLDRTNRLAYAALSDRTSLEVLGEFCSEFNYSPMVFEAFSSYNRKRVPIYHTNVMMNVGESFAVVCADSIDDENQRTELLDTLQGTGKETVLLSEEQNAHFAGNMLQVSNDEGKRILVMSTQAYHSLKAGQIEALQKHTEILHSPLNVIESIGGGSARCMMAEIFLPTKSE